MDERRRAEPSVTSREDRKPYDIDSLTDVALRVFAERGYDGASMDDVARAAGITKASIYHHVAGKEALLARGLQRALTALFSVIEEPQAVAGPPLERLRHIGRRVAELTIELRPEVTLLFRVRGNSPTEVHALERRRAFDRIVADLVQEAVADASVRSDFDARLMTRLIFGMSNSVVEWYREDGRQTPREIVAAIEGLALHGLTGPPRGA